MNILFVKAPKIGSKFIQWGLEQDVSHVVVEFDGHSHQFFHSYGFGMSSLSYDEFLTFDYTVVKSIELKLERKDETVVQSFFSSGATYQKYDWPALFYFAWRAFLFKFFKRPYPKKNKYAVMDRNLCTEAIYLAAECYAKVTGHQIIPSDVDLAMITPKDAYYKINFHVKEMGL